VTGVQTCALPISVNHEFTDEGFLHTATATVPDKANWTFDMVRKSQAAHGVSVVEIERLTGGEWVVVRGGFNRRITANTPMSLSGPVAGHPLVRTSADPQGMTPLGTFNNCSHGVTPWHTYLTCEENLNGYFRVEAGTYTPQQQALLSRYGVGGDRNNWAIHDSRFVVTPGDANEPNRCGWVVEFDPFDPQSRPVKRTALGRVKHESATVHTTKDDRVVVYTGSGRRRRRQSVAAHRRVNHTAVGHGRGHQGLRWG
jgi:secreted PhoX family phosphatase